MRRTIVSLTGFLLLSALTGCGARLNSGNVRKLELGQTTESQVRAMFGKPGTTDTRADSGGQSKVFKYDHVGGAAIAFYRLADLRYLVTELYNGRLRGYLFASTAGGDATKYDKAAVGRIKAGVTTRDEVVRLLGRPAGRALQGTHLDDFKDAFTPGVTEVWAWTAIDGANAVMWADVTTRLLLVKFDASGRVVETATRAVQT